MARVDRTASLDQRVGVWHPSCLQVGRAAVAAVLRALVVRMGSVMLEVERVSLLMVMWAAIVLS